MRVAVRCIATMSFLLGPVAAAQAPLAIPPGTRVRITTTGVLTPAEQIGRLVALRPDSVLLDRDDDASGPIAIPRSAVTDVAVSLGRQSKAQRGMAIGVISGAAAGAWLGSKVRSKPLGCSRNDLGANVICGPGTNQSEGQGSPHGFVGTGVGAVVGLVIGGLVGRAHQTEYWAHADGSSAALLRMVPEHVALGESDHGATLALAVNF
jgi:hypothetical protein